MAKPMRAYDSEGRRQCPKCGNWFPLSGFPREARNRDGRYAYCNHCCHEMWKKRLVNDPGMNARYREAKYGLPPGSLARMLNAAGGACQICGVVFKSEKAAKIDHDHKTGHVRGLLCNNCNVGLGAFSDSIERLALAINYMGGGKR